MLPLPFIFINYTTYTKKKENKSLFNLFLLIIEESLQSIGFTNRKISLFDYNGRKDFRILSFYFCIISLIIFLLYFNFVLITKQQNMIMKTKTALK